MVVRCDAQTRTVTLSVRDVADTTDYRFVGPAPLPLSRRAVLGREAHEEHQGAREEDLASYRRERSLRYETRLDGWRAVVTGRIDGIYTDAAGRTVIEEVKTVMAQPAEVDEAGHATYPAYARQLQLYRYLLEECAPDALGFQGGAAPEIALHLCLIALPSRHRRTVEVPYRRDDVRDLLVARLREVLAEHDASLARGDRRRSTLAQARFPFDAPRPHQDAMLAAIESALARGARILASAPPGVGKTAAALVAAMRHAGKIGGRVFVATSKTTQQAIFAETVRRVRAAGTPVRAVVLQAKERACLNDVVHCHPDACEHARDYAGKLARSGAVDRLLAAPVADPEAVRAEAQAHLFCPFEAALDLTADVDVVIGDYNYVFDPGAALRRMFVDEDPSDVVLVIDEAHNLHERGIDYYSPELRRDALRALDAELGRSAHPILRRARGVLRRLLDYLDALDRGAGAPRRTAPRPAAARDAPGGEGGGPPPPNLLLFDDPDAARAPRRARPRPTPEPDEVEPAPDAAEAPLPAPGDVPPEREVEVDRRLFAELRDELDELAVAWFLAGDALAGDAGGRDAGGRDAGGRDAGAGSVRGRVLPAARGKTPRRASFEDPLHVLQRIVGRFAGVLELARRSRETGGGRATPGGEAGAREGRSQSGRRRLVEDGDEFAFVYRRTEGGALKVLCLDPSRQLGRRIAACAGAVAVSATLEPLEFYRDVLGFPADAELRRFPSPFDPRRRRVLVLDRPSTHYHERERDLPIVEDAVRAVLAARAGNYLVCCPSFEYLEKLAPFLSDVPGFDVLRQQRAMDEAARADVLERLASAAARRTRPVALLAVQGGIFTEGVDYPGELCVGVVVVGPGLPRVTFERDLMRAYYQRTRGKGFEFAYLFPGMSKVVQAAGRVIRTATDRGVVALVGNRFATERYMSLLPRDWYRQHARELVCQDPYGELVRFWRSEEEAPLGAGPAA